MSSDDLKRQAAAKALEFVRPGMRLGLGTGSTAKHFVDLLAERVRGGLNIVGVPTSEATRAQAERLGVPLTTLDETPELDLTVDGADEFDPALQLIKGGGGALLREKIVASASGRMIVITDSSKRVERLGRFPLPVEVAPFGLEATRRAVAAALHSAGCPGEMDLRKGADGAPFVTDGGHYILDCRLGAIPDAERLAEQLLRVPGVMENGLFLGLADAIIVAAEGGIEILGRPEGRNKA
jgi:ribose 5-phosphate isomerase A